MNLLKKLTGKIKRLFDSFKVIKVPIQNPDKSLTLITSDISIENGIVKVLEKRIFTGYEKVDFITDYTYKKDDKTEEEFLNTTLAYSSSINFAISSRT